jgi:formylglycine-generating enzyme required for sulfatase activity
MPLVSWGDAMAYAEWAKGDLPTEAQWEKAARWSEKEKRSYEYPWGDDFDAGKCWGGSFEIVTRFDGHEPGRVLSIGVKHPRPRTHSVGELGVSPYGCTDMAGNLWQWCKDRYDADYWKTDHGPDPQGPGVGVFRVQRGGSKDTLFPVKFRATYRGHGLPGYARPDSGFRCVVAGGRE